MTPLPPGPLAGIRVVDLTRVLAGSLCTRQLADLGADVIRVGDPSGTEVMHGASAANVARNKRSILVDLRRPAGRDVFLRLCESADVVVENFRPEVKHRLRVDPESVWAVNDRVVYGSISGFGQNGPYADRPGVDLVAQALSGLMSITGAPGSGPWPAGTALSDIAAGSFLTQGILAALIARERTGRGQHVCSSVLEAAVSFMDPYASRYLMEGQVSAQAGGNPTNLPMGTFRTKDGWVTLAAQFAWESFAAALGSKAIADDPRFATAASRAANWPALRELLAETLAGATTGYWVETLVGAKVPVSAVNGVDGMLADPQVRHLRMAERLDWGEGEYWGIRHAVTLSETPASIRRPPPEPGADTDDILREYGFDAPEIERLRAERIVG